MFTTLRPCTERIKSNFKQVELSKEQYEAVTKVGEGNYTR